MLRTVPRSIPGSRRRLAVVAVTFLSLLGCSSSDDDDTATATEAPTPRGVVAIGHSGLTGASSDPDRPGQDALENSWATGTSPAVDSVYLRLVAASPEHEGHVANHGIDGASAAELPAQAEAALADVPAPLLVIIQTLDNDIRCDGTDEAHVEDFGRSVADVHLVYRLGPDGAKD